MYDILSCLPKELIITIISYLDTSSLFSLSLTSKFYRNYTNHNEIYDTVLTDAIVNGYTDLFKLLVPDKTRLCLYNAWKYMEYAALTGSFEILKHLCVDYTNSHILNCAAEGGHLEIVKWLHTKGYSFSDSIFASAAAGGNIELAKYIYDSYLENINNIKNGYNPLNTRATANAALNGHFEMLKWLRSINCPWTRVTCIYAADKGHLEILIWLKDQLDSSNEEKYYLLPIVIYRAAANGHLKILKWLKDIGATIDDFGNDGSWRNHASISAVSNGHFEIVEWLRENNLLW